MSTRYICETLHVGTDGRYCHACGDQFPSELDDAKRAEVETTLVKRVGEVARALATLPTSQALAGSPWLVGWIGADEHSPSGVWIDRTPGGWIVDGWVCAGWWDGDDYHEDQIVAERVVVGVRAWADEVAE